MLRLSAGRLLTWVVGIRSEQASQIFGVQFRCSQPEVYAVCPLKYSLNTNKVAICERQSHFVRKRVIRRQENSFYCDPHARQVANSCVAELTAGLLNPADKTGWDSFAYI